MSGAPGVTGPTGMTLEERTRLAVALAPLYAAGLTPRQVGRLLELRCRFWRRGLPPRLDGLDAAARRHLEYGRALRPWLLSEEWRP